MNASVSSLSGREDSVGVTVTFPLLLTLLLAVRGQSLLQLFLIFKEVSPCTHDVLLNFAMPLHV